MSKSKSAKYVETKVLTTYFYLLKSFSLKKRGLELVSLTHFVHDLLRKIILTLHYIN